MTQWQVSTRALTSIKPHVRYRTTEKLFRSEKRAREYYAKQIKLFSPEYRVTLGKLVMGMAWMILEDNTKEHHLWRFDTHGIPSGVFNLGKVRESLTASK